jgi:hypothetical protein
MTLPYPSNSDVPGSGQQPDSSKTDQPSPPKDAAMKQRPSVTMLTIKTDAATVAKIGAIYDSLENDHRESVRKQRAAGQRIEDERKNRLRKAMAK